MRNTPTANGKSPAEVIYGHPLRDNLPMIPTKFSTSDNARHTTKLVKNHIIQKQYYDRNTKTKPNARFVPGQRVAVQHESTEEWSLRGKIIRYIDPRSYEIKLENGHVSRRNQTDLRQLYAISAFCAPRKYVAVSLPVSPNDSDTGSVDTIPYDNEMDDIVDDINKSVETTPYDEMEYGIEREVYITKSGRKSK